MRKNILVYNNCSNIAEKLMPLCAGEEISVQRLETGQEKDLAVYCRGFNLILLDIFMDKKYWADGIKLIKEIRAESKIPIIIVSSQQPETIKILCLNAGADDFIGTNTNPLEILARIKVQIRRYTQMADVSDNIEQIHRIDGLEVNDARRVVTVNGKEVHLTATEYKILRFLINQKGKVYSGDEIYEAVWGMRPVGVENTIAVHIRHIREKIEEDPAKPHYLKVAWGKGYKVG